MACCSIVDFATMMVVGMSVVYFSTVCETNQRSLIFGICWIGFRDGCSKGPQVISWFLVSVELASGMHLPGSLVWYLDVCLCWIGFGFEFAKESHVPSWFLISIVLVSGLDLPRVFKWHLDVWSRVSNGILDIFSRCCLLIIRRWGLNPGSFSCFLNWGKGGYWARTTKRLNYGCNCWHILCISARHSRRAFPIGLRWRPPWNQRSRIS
mgnify:CR=1 FL=1